MSRPIGRTNPYDLSSSEKQNLRYQKHELERLQTRKSRLEIKMDLLHNQPGTRRQEDSIDADVRSYNTRIQELRQVIRDNEIEEMTRLTANERIKNGEDAQDEHRRGHSHGGYRNESPYMPERI